MERITDVSTATALREKVVERFAGDNKIAAFNTDGWIKSRVTLPPRDTPQNRNSLAGIYIRTRYLDFTFFRERTRQAAISGKRRPSRMIFRSSLE